MEHGWEDMSCDSDTSPNFNLAAPRSQDETEAANMLSKTLCTIIFLLCNLTGEDVRGLQHVTKFII